LLPDYVSPRLEPAGVKLGDRVNEAIAALTGCSPGSRCVIAERPQAWHARLAGRLREDGFDAGQHEPTSDEIAVAHPVTGAWEGFKVYAGAWDDPAGTGTVVWYRPVAEPIRPPWSGSARPVYAPGASSSPDGCGPPAPPPLVGFVIHKRAIRDGWSLFDSTPLVGGMDYCRAVGFNRNPCPLRLEGSSDRLECERRAIGGHAPVWEWTGDPGAGGVRDNPFSFEARNDAPGELRACNASRSVCSRAER
jgi:hypothetical protein